MPKAQKARPHVHQRDKIKDDLIIKEIEWTEKQKEFIETALDKQTKIFFIKGFAGTSKTFLSVYCALKLLNRKRISDIIYIRSAVESSESKLGFLPGDIDDKLKYYNMPFYDKLEELLKKSDVDKLISDNRISIHPVNFARGMSWNSKCIIMDECFAGFETIVTDAGKKTFFTLEENQRLGKKNPLVKTFNEKTKQFEFKKIKSVWKTGNKNIIKVLAGGRNINVTENHMFLTSEGWRKAKDLRKGNILLANDVDSRQVLKSLNDDQLQIVLGSYLGDGSIQKVGENRFRLNILHGYDHKDYCEWKASMFNRETTTVSENEPPEKKSVRFITECFYLNRADSNWVLQNLNERGLAIWFMNNGSTDENFNQITLHTQTFSKCARNKLSKKIKDFGLECSIKKYSKRGKEKYYYQIDFNKENTIKFLNIVSPYIHNSLNYKTNLDSGTYKWDNSFNTYNHIVCDGILNNHERCDVYDIEVEDNHNFIVCSKNNKSLSGVIAHNCQNSSVKELVTVITRLGKFNKCFILADPMQTDLHNGKGGGFEKLYNLFENTESKEAGIFTFEFSEDDIVRSDLVAFIVKKLKFLK